MLAQTDEKRNTEVDHINTVKHENKATAFSVVVTLFCAKHNDTNMLCNDDFGKRIGS